MDGTTVLVGDCRELMRCLPECSVDAVVTDPPYGLSREPDIVEVLTHWLAGDAYSHGCGGFMGKTWDSFVPGPEYWREVYRVLKPGAYALVFASSRTFDLMGIALRLSGFEMHPFIAWLNGSGFPKATNLSKMLDRDAGMEREVGRYARPDGSAPRDNTIATPHWSGQFSTGNDSQVTAPASDAAKQWDGWFYGKQSMKPAMEPILLVQKPPEGRMVDNIRKWGTGALNVGACRIGTGADKSEGGSGGLWSHIRDGKPYPNGRDGEESAERRYDDKGGTNFAATPGPRGGSPQGRWPANVLLQHHPECVCRGTKRVKGVPMNAPRPNSSKKPFDDGKGWNQHGMTRQGQHAPEGYAAPDGTEEVADWDCHPDCPCAMFPETKNGGNHHGDYETDGIFGKRKPPKGGTQYAGDSGSAARFFAQFDGSEVDGEPTRFRYQAKASRRERYFFCRDCQAAYCETERSAHQHGHVNGQGRPDWSHIVSHPTVKPGAHGGLMAYLCKLVTPPGGLILDPFGGTGTTAVAARAEGFRCIVMEQDPEYVEIIRARVRAADQDSPRPADRRPKPKSRSNPKQLELLP